MIALGAVSDELRKYPMVTDRLMRFAGPQCFPHLDPSSVDYRVLANQVPKGEEEAGDEGLEERKDGAGRVAPGAWPAVLDEDSWLQCDRCQKWRCVKGSCAASLRGDDFFDVKDTDLDWARWLAGAEVRYNMLLAAPQGDGVEQMCAEEGIEASAKEDALGEAAPHVAETMGVGGVKDSVAAGAARVVQGTGVRGRVRRLRKKISEPEALAKASGVHADTCSATMQETGQGGWD